MTMGGIGTKKTKTIRSKLDRRSGIAIWRQIADYLRNDINAGVFLVSDRLPSEIALAKRFDVNRHTVRAALDALAGEGIVESRQGHGTVVKKRNRLVYPIGKRTRFSDGLSNQVQSVSGSLVSHRVEMADDRVAEALNTQSGANVVRLETISHADGTPLSCATSWFTQEKFGDIATHYEETRSITQSLKRHGIVDYIRLSTQIEAHHASVDDARALRLSPGAIVLVTQAVNGDVDGNPIQFSKTRFAADRVSLMIREK